jgi:hypothetical protein
MASIRRRAGVIAGIGICALASLVPWGAAAFASSSGPTHSGLLGLRVEGNQLVNHAGQVVHLHGVNRSGTEYACIQGWGIFNGPNGARSVAAIRSWDVNIVRIPINEDCWLGINGVKPRYAGRNYRRAIVDYVRLLHRYGMYAELSLMWAAPGPYRATTQPAAPDESHAPKVWASMAATFRHDPDVILAPWGETTTGWTCFMRTGCDNEATYGPWGARYLTASMQQAVDVMRGEGYRGVISIPCIDYAQMCGVVDGTDFEGSSWLASRPNDPLHQLVAEAHVYGETLCDTLSCFDSSMLPITKVVPLIFGEVGETYNGSSCAAQYVPAALEWADAHGVGYEAWTWDTWGNCEVLIANWSGTPYSSWATWVRTHYVGDTQRWGYY